MADLSNAGQTREACLNNPSFRREQLEHWQKTEEQTGRPVLSWREMAILGWSTERAQDHRGTSTLRKTGQMLKEARSKLRKEGWRFDSRQIGCPPIAHSRSAGYLQERADAQRKSSWFSRLPASARKVR